MNVAQSRDIGAYVRNVVGIIPEDSAAATINGPGFDRTGHDSVKVTVSGGAETGAPTSKTIIGQLQDSADNTTFADYVPPQSATIGTPDATVPTVIADDASAEKDVDLSGARQYVRVELTVAFVAGTTPTVPVSATMTFGPKQGTNPSA